MDALRENRNTILAVIAIFIAVWFLKHQREKSFEAAMKIKREADARLLTESNVALINKIEANRVIARQKIEATIAENAATAKANRAKQELVQAELARRAAEAQATKAPQATPAIQPAAQAPAAH